LPKLIVSRQSWELAEGEAVAVAERDYGAPRLVWADLIELRSEIHRECHVEWEKRPMKVRKMVGDYDNLWKESENHIDFLRSIGQFGIESWVTFATSLTSLKRSSTRKRQPRNTGIVADEKISRCSVTLAQTASSRE
jgi:hypothetical protein